MDGVWEGLVEGVDEGIHEALFVASPCDEPHVTSR